jgi:REP element-mobilizing transposase RayT
MSDRASSHRLRTGRFSCSGQVYLVTTNTHLRQPVFSDFYLGRKVVSELKRADQQGQVTSLAWVVMPDHLHWLFELKHGTLDGLIKQVKGASSLAINKMLVTNSPLWQRGYHDKALRAEDHLVTLARYVIANPVRAGLVKRVADYPLWDAIWV